MSKMHKRQNLLPYGAMTHGMSGYVQFEFFGNPDKQSNETIAEAFRIRLKDVAGFAKVPKPIPMRNSKRAIVYYLFFASQKGAAENIVLDIFEKYRTRGAL